MKPTLTVIILARNEEKQIGACLSRVAFADERIVIDNNSTDATASVAKKYHATVIPAAENNFSALRTIGLQHATGKWVLYIDADEEVGKPLRDEILQTIINADKNAYKILRDTYFLGQHWPYKDSVERLFLRTNLKGWKGVLHETPIYSGNIGILQNPLVHRTHSTLEEMVAKTNEWSLLEADLRLHANHPPVVWWRLLRVMMTGFNRSYWQQGGWRAGTVGLIESMYQAFSMFITYAKLWELQQKKGKT